MNRKTRLYLILSVFTVIIVASFLLTGCKKGSSDASQTALPSVATAAFTSVTANSVIVGGSVTSEGSSPVTAKGVCWSTSPTPFITENVVTGGTGTGDFHNTISGLFQGTTYYIRAYATNSAGTAYGLIMTFTTPYLPYPYSYFPLAVWMQDPVKTALQYKLSGINTMVALWNPLDVTQWTAIKSAGLRLVTAQNDYGLTLGSDTILSGWLIPQDEPDNAQWNAGTQKYDPCIDPSIIITEYNTFKQKDPTRPVFLGLGQGVAYNNYIGRGACRNNINLYMVSNNGYLVGCDNCAFDIYPVNNSDGITTNKLEYVALGTKNLIAWSGGKPAWNAIETTRIADTSPRRPTTAEVKEEVWMAIIHGAKGIDYFCHSFVTGATDESAMLHDPEMMAAISGINAQITALAAVLNSPTTTGYATVSTSNTSVPVDIMTKIKGGANYIFAIAMNGGDTSSTFSVTSGTKAEVLGEGRAIIITNGQFIDTFTPYAVHLYKITN
jgi:hypothetical protein